MPSYDAVDFEPPAPVARARVTSSTLTAADVPMLLDTGADVSVVLGLLRDAEPIGDVSSTAS